ncbi:Conserved_hypothetical protein [Hexamita inflata]|uniref:Uncharacterized protein n=1 Tax=Hexamita inflata TaxID=28002 RepID=A0AA86RFE2_9EUKA|nr:Conserved hypothetical protein [Hexamita inflata]
MIQLTKLSLVQSGLRNVDSLKYLINLKELNLSQNYSFLKQIDITPLQNLPLTVLNLSSSDFQNTEILASFIHLQNLNLSGKKDVDITPLYNLLQLIKLDIRDCNLGNVNSLKRLVNLKELNLQLNKNIDISQLQYLSQLIVVNLNSCELKSIETLRYLVNLEDLSINNNKIIFIQPLQHLSKLRYLDAEINLIIDICSITNHPNFKSFLLGFQDLPKEEQLTFAKELTELERNYDQIMTEKYLPQIAAGSLKIDSNTLLKSLEFIQNMNIYRLELINCPQIPPILNCNSIKELSLNDCNVSDFNSLQLDSLEKLFIQYMNNKNIEEHEQKENADKYKYVSFKLIYNIVKFSQLKELSINGYVAVDISPLYKMIQLTKLSLVQSGLGNVDSLKYLINLKELNLSNNNQIFDISPLYYLKQLSVLNLCFCGLYSIETLKYLINLEDVQLEGTVMGGGIAFSCLLCEQLYIKIFCHFQCG